MALQRGLQANPESILDVLAAVRRLVPYTEERVSVRIEMSSLIECPRCRKGAQDSQRSADPKPLPIPGSLPNPPSNANSPDRGQILTDDLRVMSQGE